MVSASHGIRPLTAAVPVTPRVCPWLVALERETARLAEERDAYLEQVLIGGREPLAIAVVDYDERWPRRFQVAAGRVRQVLGEQAQTVEHIGSAAVPGLATKAIVDMLLTVRQVSVRRRTCRRWSRSVSCCASGNGSTGCSGPRSGMCTCMCTR